MPTPLLKLNTGAMMPAIGHGTWSGTTPEENQSALPWLLSALESGFRHFDTAYGYGTEGVVGQAIRESGIPRSEIFVTTKLPNHHHSCVVKSLDESLERFGCDYFDLYLIHFPQSFPPKDIEGDCQRPDGSWETVEHPTVNETWAQMEAVLKTGKVRAIGVSNFSVKTLTRLLETATIIPAVDEVEMHPHLNQKALKEFCDTKGIVMTAYSPTGYAPVREDPAVIKIAESHKVSPAQVSLAWHVQRGTSAIPKSSNIVHQKANLNLPTLTSQEMEALNSLDRNTHLCQTPGPKDQVFGWTYEQLGW